MKIKLTRNNIAHLFGELNEDTPDDSVLHDVSVRGTIPETIDCDLVSAKNSYSNDRFGYWLHFEDYGFSKALTVEQFYSLIESD